MASPSPVPPKRRVVEASAWLKAENRRACWAASMPMPVSRTTKRRRTPSAPRPASSTSSDTSPCSVNLTALPTRLIRICCSRMASPTSAAGTSGSTPMASSMFFSPAFSVITVAMAFSTSLSWNAMGASSMRPASILEKSSTSFRMPSRALPDASIMSRYFFCTELSSVLPSK